MQPKDIVFVGAGVATALTVIELIEQLRRESVAQGANIPTLVVVEKNAELWKGIPYGHRSSPNALVITPIADFIYERDRQEFYAYLQNEQDTWVPDHRARGGAIADKWLTDNLPKIDQGEWDKVYTPRYLFGNYIAAKTETMLKSAVADGLLKFEAYQAAATDITPLPDGTNLLTLELPNKAETDLLCRKLVLSVGSAPVKTLAHGDVGGLYIHDIYEPSATGHMKALEHLFCNSGDPAHNRLLIVGSNASSIELLYHIAGNPLLRQALAKTVIISPSGALPLHTSTQKLTEYPMPALQALRERGGYEIVELSKAALADMQPALANGANMDYVGTIVSTTLQLMDVLDDQQKREFYAIHAIKMRDMFRRAGPEYKGAALMLTEAGRLEIVKGRFVAVAKGDHGMTLTYTDADGLEKTYPEPFQVLVNCTGSQNLDVSESPLINHIVNKGLCAMNLSGKGIDAGEDFLAAPGIYIMGPLLGGNMNKLIHFWQLENVSRLSYLAPYLAKELLKAE